MYEIGKVYIWQNQTGVFATLNGKETTVTGAPEDFVDIYTNKLVRACPTDTWVDGDPAWAGVGELRPKDPPKGEQSILDLFKLPEIEPA